MGVLEKEQLYIFDIDRTLITTHDSKADLIWIKNMKPPFKKTNDHVIEGSNGTYAVLHQGTRKVLQHLQDQNKQIGFLSVGALLDVDYEEQPTIIIMKMFDIYSYFNHKKLLRYKTVKKDEILKHEEDCVFFDDDEKHIVAALKLDNVTVVDRKSFTSWEQLL